LVNYIQNIKFLTFSLLSSLQIWLQPEKDQLRSGFSNLKQLYLHDIFVGFGLMWTTTLLEAAPSLEILRVEVVLLVLLFFSLEYIKENNLVTFID
jgi:hypothetical protein